MNALAPTPPAAHTAAGTSAQLRRRQALCLGAAALLAPLAARAQAAPTPADLDRSLAGTWRGVLQYRDYQSDRLLDLPMRSQVQVGPDGATLTRLSTFDDGPVTGWVYITTVSLFDAPGTSVTHAMFRKGRAVETWTEQARVQQFTDADHWTVVTLQQGRDGGQPAVIRITQTRDGPVVTARKEVKPPEASETAWAFRNQTRLVREA